jgi:hypothetical protein
MSEHNATVSGKLGSGAAAMMARPKPSGLSTASFQEARSSSSHRTFSRLRSIAGMFGHFLSSDLRSSIDRFLNSMKTCNVVIFTDNVDAGVTRFVYARLESNFVMGCLVRAAAYNGSRDLPFQNLFLHLLDIFAQWWGWGRRFGRHGW